MPDRKPTLIERIGLKLADNYIREAVGDQIDPDDHLFRRLTDTRRDLTAIALSRAQEITTHLWRSNPMAKRITEMIADFTVGAEGFTFEAEDDATQRAIDEFWDDPVMGLRERFRDLARDESIYGELAFRINRNETSGRVRLGVIMSERIKDAELDPDNALVHKRLILHSLDGIGQDELIDCVRLDEKSDPAKPKWVGDALYFAVNRLTGQKRGLPDLFALADYVDGFDQLLFNALERTGLINAFIYDVTLQGADDSAVEKWLRDNAAPPRPGSVRVHNEKEVWAAVNPQLGNQDTIALGRAAKNMALGGAGLPEAWFSDGDSANRATLAEQGDPTYRMLQSRQTHLKGMARLITQIALQEQVGKRIREAKDETTGLAKAPEFSVNAPELSAKDTGAISTALPLVANALSTAVLEEFIDSASARTVFITVAQQLGVDLDPADIEKKIEAERKKREADEAKRARDLGTVADDLDTLASAEPDPGVTKDLRGRAASIRTQQAGGGQFG